MSKARGKMAIRGAAEGFTQAAKAKTAPDVAPAATHTTPATRTGRVALPFWVPATARQQLKHTVTDLHMTAQGALTEALNDWFKKHGKPPIA
jgi:hypothetical protein